MTTRSRIVKASELAQCPQFRLDAEHWIPRHKTEQCRARLRKSGRKVPLSVNPSGPASGGWGSTERPALEETDQ